MNFQKKKKKFCSKYLKSFEYFYIHYTLCVGKLSSYFDTLFIYFPGDVDFRKLFNKYRNRSCFLNVSDMTDFKMKFKTLASTRFVQMSKNQRH